MTTSAVLPLPPSAGEGRSSLLLRIQGRRDGVHGPAHHGRPRHKIRQRARDVHKILHAHQLARFVSVPTAPLRPMVP